MTQRTPGPDAPGGFPTYSGFADGKLVHWLAFTKTDADEREAKFARASPLLRLLTLNAYTYEGLTADEIRQARNLIETVPETSKICRGSTLCNAKTIGDTGLCREHNRYALEARK